MATGESIIRRWLAAGDARRFEDFAALLHDDVLVHAPRGLSTAGRAAEVEVWRAATEAMPDLHHEVHEVLTGVDVEMARVVVTGTMKSSFGGVVGRGQRLELDQAVIVRLRNGLVIEAWEIVNMPALSD